MKSTNSEAPDYVRFCCPYFCWFRF